MKDDLDNLDDENTNDTGELDDILSQIDELRMQLAEVQAAQDDVFQEPLFPEEPDGIFDQQHGFLPDNYVRGSYGSLQVNPANGALQLCDWATASSAGSSGIQSNLFVTQFPNYPTPGALQYLTWDDITSNADNITTLLANISMDLLAILDGQYWKKGAGQLENYGYGIGDISNSMVINLYGKQLMSGGYTGAGSATFWSVANGLQFKVLDTAPATSGPAGAFQCMGGIYGAGNLLIASTTDGGSGSAAIECAGGMYVEKTLYLNGNISQTSGKSFYVGATELTLQTLSVINSKGQVIDVQGLFKI